MTCFSSKYRNSFKQLKCCGADGPADWSRSVFNGYYETTAPEIGIPKTSWNAAPLSSTQFNVPVSCCKLTDAAECQTATKNIEVGDLPLAAINNDVSITFFVELIFL